MRDFHLDHLFLINAQSDELKKNMKNEKIKNCVHQKNIQKLVDRVQGQENYLATYQHMQRCPICLEEYKKIKFARQEVKVFIPKVSMNKEMRESFNLEVDEILKLANLGPSNKARDLIPAHFNLIKWFLTKIRAPSKI